ncbi:hypothetical protein BDQ94DRAFT_118062 [Aspergillus welwitschiae]|uniref:Uncharacterized protein n=1 Tax=Aspergillus welwitschiae TaxID=1341132 RepID=A0A3F3PKF6_9EURO|nr:hypothetical protein BDQ94DRAFT_118062 [Aspergillus welwitschiae]RDH27283.1 hypothetical protein BDQ94DRAFT_118062 [Aspergillus welwitschiae]
MYRSSPKADRSTNFLTSFLPLRYLTSLSFCAISTPSSSSRIGTRLFALCRSGRWSCRFLCSYRTPGLDLGLGLLIAFSKPGWEGLYLKQIHKDQDANFFINLGMIVGVARRFVEENQR